MEYQLMNFNIPTYLLNRLLDLYCRQELKNLEDTKRIQDLIKMQSKPLIYTKPIQEFDQPVSILFDDEYDWEERFKI